MRRPLRTIQITLILGALLLSGTAHTQTPTASTDDKKGAVESHYEAGREALKLKNFEVARAEFLELWKLEQSCQGAANLGQAEMETGRYRDAAEHLGYCVHELHDASDDDLEHVKNMLAEAQAKIGTVGVSGRSATLITVGIGASVAAASAGVILGALAAGKASAMDDIESRGYPSAKRREWHDLDHARANLMNGMIWSFLGAGALGAATAVYAFTGSKPDAATRTGRVVVYPMGAGIGVLGSF